MRFTNLILFSALILHTGLAQNTAQPGQCPAGAAMPDSPTAPAWNGWGADLGNSRFQPANSAQLTASQVSQLQLKWAFGFPGTKSVLGQPSVIGGRVFLGVDTGNVYA